MKVAFVNDFKPETGAGNYAFSLYHELRKQDLEVNMIFLESEQGSSPESGEDVIKIEGRPLPLLNRTLNNLYVFPKKIPTDFDLYHATNQYLAVWGDGRRGSGRFNVYGQRVTATGKRAGSDFQISGPGSTGNIYWPAVAHNSANNQYLVVWGDGRNLNRGYDIYGRRVAG